VKPGTPAWVKARVGLLTGSHMAEAMNYLKKGGESADRRNLRLAVLAERLTDCATDHYVTAEMQWGLDTEAEARAAYVEASGNKVADAGFVLHPNIEYFGATPDGLIDHDGVFEAKCPTSRTHLIWMLAGTIPEEYKPQMISEIVCSRRKWCDFVSFDPRMPVKQQLFVRRFEPTDEEIREVETEATVFLAEVEAMFRKVTEQ
jgi:hypothetical protein